VKRTNEQQEKIAFKLKKKGEGEKQKGF